MPYTLTTPLYYVNDQPHLGSTYTTIACDALARYQRLRNGVRALRHRRGRAWSEDSAHSGTTASLPQEHCDRISATYRELWARWGISQDRFVRTTDPRHLQLVRAVLCTGRGLR